MNAMAIIKERWLEKFTTIKEGPVFRRLLNGDLEPKHYAGLLRQIFHHARENPQIQALATVRFRGEQREMVKPFLKHATSEIGHDQLALNDLAAMGYATDGIPTERPLGATTALLGFVFYQIEHLDPLGYLGYLFHLEFMPTNCGPQVLKTLESIGVPKTATTFLHDHSTIDIGHNKLMELYVDKMVKTPEQIETVVTAALTTGDLYTNMIAAAFAQGEKM